MILKSGSQLKHLNDQISKSKAFTLNVCLGSHLQKKEILLQWFGVGKHHLPTNAPHTIYIYGTVFLDSSQQSDLHSVR